MKNTGRFYIARCDDTILVIRKSMLTLGPRTILWCHKGLCALVPIDTVEDALLKLRCDPDNPDYYIHWDQTMFQSSDLGSVLVSPELLETA